MLTMKRTVKKISKTGSMAVRIMASVAKLSASSVIRKNDSQTLGVIEDVLFGSRRLGVYPSIDLSRLVSRQVEVRLLDLTNESYTVSHLELLALAALTRQVGANLVFEFGTGDGRTTRNLAANIDTGGMVYTINIDPGEAIIQGIGRRFQGTPEAGQITQLWGNSKSFDFSQYLGRFQLVFVDADHKDHSVWQDSQTALKLIDRGRGLIVWHDALRFGVQTALPRLMRQENLPINIISETNLALLCFAGGSALTPDEWFANMDSSN